LWFEANPGKKVKETTSQPIAEHSEVHLSSELHREVQPGHRARSNLKNNQRKRAGGIAQMVKCLPYNFEALVQIPVLPKINS
jgi:hypothetical protein